MRRINRRVTKTALVVLLAAGSLFAALPDSPSQLGQRRSYNGAFIEWGIWTNDLTPEATFYLSDTDGGQQVKFQIQVSSKASFATTVIDILQP